MYLHFEVEFTLTQTFGLLSNFGTNLIEEYPECSRSAVKKQLLLTAEVWIDFWALCSVPLVYMPVLMPVPCCFDYSGLAV